jgi:uncharacterized protein YjbJ (UPF0337 family)
MNNDTVEGKVQEIGGKVRSAVGHATGDKEAEARGKADEAKGNIRKNFGEAKSAIANAIDK